MAKLYVAVVQVSWSRLLFRFYILHDWRDKNYSIEFSEKQTLVFKRIYKACIRFGVSVSVNIHNNIENTQDYFND